MKVMAFVCLHYGSDYLGWAIRSVYSNVSRILILYSGTPSHGHGTNMVNPDTEEELKASAYQFGDPESKIMWVSGSWGSEGGHRGAAMKYAKSEGCEAILVLDADEVWHPAAVEPTVRSARDQSARVCRVQMVHFWRSFSHVCTDAMTQERVIMVDRRGSDYSYAPMYESPDGKWAPVCHFGYARRPEDIAYKISVHGHKPEWRPEWFGTKFMVWPPPDDLHPTCVNTWTAKPYDPKGVPEFLKQHPYYDMEPIA